MSTLENSPAHYIKRLRTDPLFFYMELMAELGKFRYVAPPCDIFTDAYLHAFGGPFKRGVLMPRGSGKTTQIVAPLCVHALFLNPVHKIIDPSKSTGEARKTLQMVRKWISQVWFLKHLTPRSGQRDGAEAFCVNGHDGDRQPSLSCIGIEGQLEANRAHLILPDDVETKQNTRTASARDTLRKMTTEFDWWVYSGLEAQEHTAPTGICYFGTPKHEETLFLSLANRGYAIRSYPIVYPNPRQRIIGLAPMLADRLVDGTAQPGQPAIPARFDAVEVASRMRVGRREFEMENVLAINSADTQQYPLKLRDFIVYPVNRELAPSNIAWGQIRSGLSTRLIDIDSLGFEDDAFYGPAFIDDRTWQPYQDRLMTIDPASGTKTTSDPIGYSIVFSLNGLYHIPTVGSLPGGASPENVSALARIARAQGVRRVSVERNFGGEFFAPILQQEINRLAQEPETLLLHPKGWSATVETHHNTGQKERRIIEVLDPLLQSHRLIIDPSVAKNENLQRQLTRLTIERNCLDHDDEIDALADACRLLSTSLSLDPTAAADAERKARLLKALEDDQDEPKAEARWMDY